LYDDLHAKKWDVCENLKKYEKVHWNWKKSLLNVEKGGDNVLEIKKVEGVDYKFSKYVKVSNWVQFWCMCMCVCRSFS